MKTFRNGRAGTTFFLIGAALLIALLRPAGGAAEPVTLLLTSNLEGRFIPDIEGQETRDPMLLLGQSVVMESRKGKVLYMDLGNSFYPGVLSKHNYGGAMMDFFRHFRCRSTLVSSMDLRIGVAGLEFLRKQGGTALLSANIRKDGSPLFTPYVIQEIQGKRVAFVGLSSKKILFDIAEKNLYRIAIEDEAAVLNAVIPELDRQSVGDIVLISGLTYRENVKLLNAFPRVRLVLSGGDHRGVLTGGRVVRLELADRRSIITVPPDMGYCLLTLTLDGGLAVSGIQFRKPAHYAVDDGDYEDFVGRLTQWKKQFAAEQDMALTRIDRPVRLDQGRIAHLLQDYTSAEVAIVKNNTVNPMDLGNDIRLVDVLSAVNDNYAVYTYRLTGEELIAIRNMLGNYAVAGYRDRLIQGYIVMPRRKYLVVSTQTVFEEIQKALQKKIAYKNTWKTIPDVIIGDLRGRKAVLAEDFGYIERRFRYLIDMFFSAYYEASRIIVDRGVKVPVGETSKSYTKWGVEGKIDFVFYNRHHTIMVTPYINYLRQNRDYLKNLIRGTVAYMPNLHPIVNPYIKSQIDTVLLPVRGATMPAKVSDYDSLNQFMQYRKLLRPVTIRETLGMNIHTKFLTGTFGCGIEKYVHDPVRPVVFGFEMLVNMKYEFLPNLAYSLKLDSFLSLIGARGSNKENNYFRSEIENAITIKMNNVLGVSLKHRWYYFQNLSDNRRYSNSQIVTSCDVKTDFKI
ncbi:MAG TPA: hypothetical protein PLM53_16240 [Spirochaetota bacterium]|nr:hypothetical protein [Spirochaetota bacterium]HQF10052.1 hypothetical protein [Spirochaetota bacterium]HQH98647.1 hypothetical protein [Spirochaetota bacterium]HQJ72124.1 hypothetical protein [Spirochaetota bacterium]HRS77705.1 hypothetical protein [Spirochaetota bacterium]